MVRAELDFFFCVQSSQDCTTTEAYLRDNPLDLNLELEENAQELTQLTALDAGYVSSEDPDYLPDRESAEPEQVAVTQVPESELPPSALSQPMEIDEQAGAEPDAAAPQTEPVNTSDPAQQAAISPSQPAQPAPEAPEEPEPEQQAQAVEAVQAEASAPAPLPAQASVAEEAEAPVPPPPPPPSFQPAQASEAPLSQPRPLAASGLQKVLAAAASAAKTMIE